MRDFILLYLNGTRHEIASGDAFLPLAQYLRERHGLTGVKIVCGEGACGACTVLIGEPSAGGELRYRTGNACLLRVFQMDRRHVVTVEGLASADGTLSPVQTAMVQNNGAQCGYCTPGVVLSLTAACAGNVGCDKLSGVPDARAALSGNLCRCTGYLPILRAAQALPDVSEVADNLRTQYPAAPMRTDFVDSATGVLLATTAAAPLLHTRSANEALAFLAAFPAAQIIAGGTGRLLPEQLGAHPILSLADDSDLSKVDVQDDAVYLGAGVTWATLGESEATSAFPALADVVSRYGSPQLRNRGTVGGSIVAADGNSDWLPLLLIQNAQVHSGTLRDGAVQERQVPIADFFTQRCAPGELMLGVTIPLPAPNEKLRVYKVRRRQAYDRSTFCAAVSMTVQDDTIVAARAACGGVGKLPVRLTEAEDFLVGAAYTEEIMRRAGEIAAGEIAPVTDAYADAAYRTQLTRQLFLRYLHETDSSEIIV